MLGSKAITEWLYEPDQLWLNVPRDDENPSQISAEHQWALEHKIWYPLVPSLTVTYPTTETSYHMPDTSGHTRQKESKMEGLDSSYMHVEIQCTLIKR